MSPPPQHARNRFDAVIVGAGHAGAQAAIALRLNGFVGSIALIGREPFAPYERPPLSKEYLAGEKPFERLLIRPEPFWASKDITLQLASEVVEVHWQDHAVTFSDGRQVEYGSLIWAAGGDARKLSCAGSDLAGVHTVRDRADVDRLKSELGGRARKVAVVGGGYIGLEAAAVLRKLGCEVVLLETLDRVLSRVAGESLSRFYEDEHRRQGVEVRLNVTVESLVGDHGRVTGVRLANGELIDCDLVVVGIGIVPATVPLIAAGAAGSNGVDVNALCQTNLPDVYAIGDCAAHANTFAGGALTRLESVQNANDMATSVAKTICGQPHPYRSVPWFWSNQYDLRLQTVGLTLGFDQSVVRGDPAARSFSVIYLRDGHVIALDCVNCTKDYVQGRVLVESRRPVDGALLGDPAIALKDLNTDVTPAARAR